MLTWTLQISDIEKTTGHLDIPILEGVLVFTICNFLREGNCKVVIESGCVQIRHREGGFLLVSGIPHYKGHLPGHNPSIPGNHEDLCI